ncbi:hypothetical protein C8R43DRAFT_1129608 [Mycena crocata]|nr:hypothetical protein C8R43DRAFT_1129608 [Mycena crocata]
MLHACGAFACHWRRWCSASSPPLTPTPLDSLPPPVLSSPSTQPQDCLYRRRTLPGPRHRRSPAAATNYLDYTFYHPRFNSLHHFRVLHAMSISKIASVSQLQSRTPYLLRLVSRVQNRNRAVITQLQGFNFDQFFTPAFKNAILNPQECDFQVTSLTPLTLICFAFGFAASARNSPSNFASKRSNFVGSRRSNLHSRLACGVNLDCIRSRLTSFRQFKPFKCGSTLKEAWILKEGIWNCGCIQPGQSHTHLLAAPLPIDGCIIVFAHWIRSFAGSRRSKHHSRPALLFKNVVEGRAIQLEVMTVRIVAELEHGDYGWIMPASVRCRFLVYPSVTDFKLEQQLSLGLGSMTSFLGRSRSPGRGLSALGPPTAQILSPNAETMLRLSQDIRPFDIDPSSLGSTTYLRQLSYTATAAIGFIQVETIMFGQIMPQVHESQNADINGALTQLAGSVIWHAFNSVNIQQLHILNYRSSTLISRPCIHAEDHAASESTMEFQNEVLQRRNYGKVPPGMPS